MVCSSNGCRSQIPSIKLQPQVRLRYHQHFEGPDQVVDASTSIHGVSGPDQPCLCRQAEGCPCEALGRRMRGVCSRGIFEHGAATANPVATPDLAGEGVTDDGQGVGAVASRPHVGDEARCPGGCVALEIVVEVDDVGYAAVPEQPTGRDGVEGVGAHAYDMGPELGHRLVDKLAVANQAAQHTQIDRLPGQPGQVVPAVQAFCPEAIAEGDAANPMSHPGHAREDLEEAPEARIEEILPHVLAFAQDQNAREGSSMMLTATRQGIVSMPRGEDGFEQGGSSRE